MPKKSARKKQQGRGSAVQLLDAGSGGERSRQTSTALPAQAITERQAGTRQASTRNMQNLWMAAMVALGCWGLAFTFVAFSNDANRYIFAGIAALIALMWSVNFGVRLRKLQAFKAR